ncbi:hypothetical protein GDO78_000219 [Eleutherodactylus coqui]|uniref:Uncharacterized protein n=1 Tax=Eleutherodactylus coqui TaxID=57060 RepID=A0A8J6FPG1_ELECQ|nr:hypothetical protein GDO78_000219 [Eleutherodactylus coqui]
MHRTWLCKRGKNGQAKRASSSSEDTVLRAVLTTLTNTTAQESDACAIMWALEGCFHGAEQLLTSLPACVRFRARKTRSTYANIPMHTQVKCCKFYPKYCDTVV